MPVFRLTDELIFPDPRLATQEGLLAVGGDLSPERLLLAYRSGIFPWYGENEPILWWSPDPRCVLFPVVASCADVRVKHGQQTWLIAEMQAAYQKLHELGFAHSVEAWEDDELVGGLYGVALGKFFFGESMFHRRTNASKVILAQLVRYLDREEFILLDCQVPNPHLASMGARDLPREDFLELLAAGGLGPGGDGEKVKLPANLP
jgi:leucyl/phenylalanyl-tRNA--protein transferase